ncbi:hypothetical protein ACWCPT_15690 [Streptomyces sp. NPDC002308]
MKRTIRTAAFTAGALIAALGLPAGVAQADTATPRVDLRVLVVTDGGPAAEAIEAELDGEGTPYTEVDLNSASRPVIDAAFLSDTVDGRPRAKFQAVVLPNDNPFATGSAEMAALTTYEQTYAIPQVDAYTYARPEVGLQYYVYGGYAGSLDGVTAGVTDAGGDGPFGYLDGSVPFEDNDASVSESYGYLAVPVEGADFTTYVDAPVPGSTGRASLVGEYRHDGRRELVVGFVYNQYQQQFKLLARGIVDWMTGGVHLGASHNYFAVHVDDIFASDDRWNSTYNCTPGDVDCSVPGATESTIRMTPADVDYATSWQETNGLTLDLAYNALGSEDYKEEHDGQDPLLTSLVADKNDFRWVNHTYSHEFLGCVQNTTVVPWVCATNGDGSTKWVSQAQISSEISTNAAWGQAKGLPIDTSELITGEHSGFFVTPQQPVDNPNLAPAFTANGIQWAGSDNSRDPQQRQVGSALTVPRYPLNIYYNAGTKADEVDEYNYIYGSRAQGGSGICDDNPATTSCLASPLSTTTGFDDYIVPLESRQALGHVLGNDPRPHYVHQSNLTEDRLLYPVLNSVLSQYRALYADSAPVVNLRQKDIGAELQRRAAWKSALSAGTVTAYRIGDDVTVEAPSGTRVPITVPTGTTLDGSAYGTAYAGERSGWTASTGTALALTLPSTAVTPPTAPTSAGPADTTSTAPDTTIPPGVTE